MRYRSAAKSGKLQLARSFSSAFSAPLTTWAGLATENSALSVTVNEGAHRSVWGKLQLARSFSSAFSAPLTLTLLAACASSQAATLSLQPYLQNVGADRASILWTTTDGPGRGEIHFSPDTSFSRIVPSEVRRFRRDETLMPYDFWLHRADLTGLEPDVAYRYRVYVDGANVTPAAAPAPPQDGELRFTTAASATSAPGGPIRFLAFGDSGDGAPVQLELMRRISFENPAFILHAGDLAYEDGTFLQLHEYFFRVYQAIAARVPIFAVPGNHDYQFRAAAAFLAMFAPPTAGVPAEGRGLYYSFDWGPIHVVALDSNQPLLDARAAGSGPMLAWLERDLQATDRQWRIAVFHHTPFPNTHHVGNENCEAAKAVLAPILERHGVHLVLTGHEHLYQRTLPQRHTVYLTTGGGGYALHPAEPRGFTAVARSVPHYLRIGVAGTTMRVQAVTMQGENIDDFELSSAARISESGIGNAATFQPPLSPGALITILGKDLVRAGESLSRDPLPMRLGGMRIRAGGENVPLLYVSRGQINAQLPYGLLSGDLDLELEGPNGTLRQPVRISEAGPAVFQISSGGERRPAVIHADGRLVTPEAPAAPGEVVSAYLTGLGPTSPALPAGFAAPAAVLHRAELPVSVTVGDADAIVLFAGLAPMLVGVNQVNFVIPPGAPGVRTLTIAAGTARSQSVALPCR